MDSFQTEETVSYSIGIPAVNMKLLMPLYCRLIKIALKIKGSTIISNVTFSIKNIRKHKQ
ncbi:hypothetical protein T4D_11302 [Trichinella pseudospiralis]|uniref:Uncharacterized protein n=1 Tax=Trichinella pseudospiralis TaxID=6337 RepID=A0A0V1FU39_TRIPS|nr:hypothetical protein T4D_11302 [Trichinella pseudospiralis]